MIGMWQELWLEAVTTITITILEGKQIYYTREKKVRQDRPVWKKTCIDINTAATVRLIYSCIIQMKKHPWVSSPIWTQKSMRTEIQRNLYRTQQLLRPLSFFIISSKHRATPSPPHLYQKREFYSRKANGSRNLVI